MNDKFNHPIVKYMYKTKISRCSDFIIIETDLGRGMFAAHR